MRLDLKKEIKIGYNSNADIIPIPYTEIYEFLEYQLGYRSLFVGEQDIYISKDVLDKQGFDIIENFRDPFYVKKLEKFVMHYPLYKYKFGDLILLLSLELTPHGRETSLNTVSIYKEGYYKVDYVYYKRDLKDSMNFIDILNNIFIENPVNKNNDKIGFKK